MAVRAGTLAVLGSQCRGRRQVGCADTQAEGAYDHHGEGHEDQPVGDSRGAHLVRDGPDNKIAAKLFLSNHTIKTPHQPDLHQDRLQGPAAATGYAHRMGIV